MTEDSKKKLVDDFMVRLDSHNPHQPEFHQAVREVANDVLPFIEDNPQYKDSNIFERMTEPDRTIIFRVTWEDDNHEICVNKGYRVQFNNTIGPYKGGLRFHPSVTLSILKFLGFEQVFKNSLTGLPMGGAKGGSNFDPKGKSDGEVMRFCQAFMVELAKHIGYSKDVPAGDIGVGAREIGFLFGQYKRIRDEFTGVLTGKALEYGGSLIRTEATGYGCVYFVEEMLKRRGDSVSGKTCVISGSGNVAQYAAEKVIQLGGKVVTFSDSGGYIFDPDGINEEKLAYVIDLKTKKRGRISEYAEKFGCEYHAGKRPWEVPCEIALPCATQNEISGEDAQVLVKNGCIAVGEGANMPTTLDGIERFIGNELLYAPGKAANAGGVAVSGLEMSQNRLGLSWSREEVDAQLRSIMQNIHGQCVEYGQTNGYVNYVQGANIAGFVKVAEAMFAYGAV